MELIISLSEQTYNSACVLADMDGSPILKAIKNGTPLNNIKTEMQDALNACINIIDNVAKGVYPQIYTNDEMVGRKITYEHCLKIIDTNINGKKQNK